MTPSQAAQEPRHTEGQGEVCDSSCPHWGWAETRTVQEKPTSPRTEAGRELLAALPLDEWHPINRDIVTDHILAIEREAAAEWKRRYEGMVKERDDQIHRKRETRRILTEREAAGKDSPATPSLPDEWLLSISIMEAARRIDLEMSVGHSWRELAMLTNAILADQYRAARLDEGSATPDPECLCGFDENPDLPRRDIVCPKHDGDFGSATPEQGKGEPR